MLSRVDTLIADVINCSPDVTRCTLVRARYATNIFCIVRSSLAIIVGLISGFKIVPFFSILIGTFVTGLVAGVPADKLGFDFTQGAGQLLGDAGIIIALGAMLGALLGWCGNILI
jgi:gluconate:H+ symporter, GntP family